MSGVERVSFLHRGCLVYQQAHDLPIYTIPYERVVIDDRLGHRIGAAYLAAPMREKSAEQAYQAFRNETLRQFDYLTRPVSRGGLGVDVSVSSVDPYADVDGLVDDLQSHRRIRVFATCGSGNEHPWFSNADNDRFRAVHDAFGHAGTGCGFDPAGEEAAWVKHSQMYTPLARRALASETRGQSCAMVYGCQGAYFPRQKAILLPAAFADLSTLRIKAGPAGISVPAAAGLDQHDNN
ncbi:hypothetical protein [Fodinicola acaciae]|uniref:hypothetical protein n=1 Tax=Fodinicola acaciae TaxID=2681555 RepID=UPI001C9EA0C8|nr:hypothetical protein [Fodinicola acaciae]